MNSVAVSTTISSGRLQLVNVRQRMLHVAKWRVVWVLAGFAIIAFAAIVRLTWLGLVEEGQDSRSLSEALLPPRLNEVYATDGGELTSGVILHTKFLPGITERSAEEKARGEHFGNADQYSAYYDRLSADPVLHTPASIRYTGWRQLEALGLMSRGGWI